MYLGVTSTKDRGFISLRYKLVPAARWHASCHRRIKVKADSLINKTRKASTYRRPQSSQNYEVDQKA